MSETAVLLSFLAVCAVVRFVTLRWWFSPVRAATDDEFAAELEQLGLRLPVERMVRYRRQVASAMGVPKKHILATAPLTLYDRFRSGILGVQPSDVLDDVVESLTRLGREHEALPESILDVVRVFAEDDDQRRSRNGPHVT